MTCDSEPYCDQARDDLQEAKKRIAELEAIVRQLASFDGRDVMMLEMLQLVTLAKRAIQK